MKQAHRRMIWLLTLLLIPLAALLWVVQPLLLPVRPAPAPAVDPERLRQHVVTLSTTLSPRNDDPAQLGRSADYIASQLAPFGRVERHPFDVWGVGYENVSLTLGSGAGPRIVVGAHYDTADGLPGADDNASGVAGLIELARLLHQQRPSRPVQIIAYALEEPPYFGSDQMGSAHHARRLAKQQEEIALMLSLEMIGYFDETPGSQHYPLPLLRLLYPDRGDFIALVGEFGAAGIVRRAKRAMLAASPLPVRSINAPAFVPGVDLSDHRNFWHHNYPALMVTDTAMFRNRAYHTAQDRWERLDYPRMAEVVRGIYGIVMAFAPPTAE